MAIASTLNQQRKYLRCHMKPASFFLHVSFHRQSDFILGHNCCLKNTYFFKKNIYYSQRKLLYLQAKT